MTAAEPRYDDATRRRVGLCAECTRARRIVSAKGSEFWLCEGARTDPRLRKYPPIPVIACPGFTPGGNHG